MFILQIILEKFNLEILENYRESSNGLFVLI